AAKVLKKIIADGNSAGYRPLTLCIRVQNNDSSFGVPDGVVTEYNILDGRPRSSTALVSCRKHDCRSRLAVDPIVLKHISIDRNAASVFQLQKVLDSPMSSSSK